MRFFAALVLSLLPVSAANLQIDHATVAGAHLDVMRQAFTTATGIPTEYGGSHANRATEMALTSFPDGSYLEFMAIQSHADPAAVSMHVWSKFLRNNIGPCAFALRSSDVSAEATRLRSAGVQVKAPAHSGRTRPDGTRLEWETSDIGTMPRGGFFPFLIRDLTPRQNRVYLTGKPTTERFTGVSKVVIDVQDLDRAISAYRRAFNLPAPRRERDRKFGAELAWFEATPIVLAQGLTADSWLTVRVQEYGEAPCAFVLSSATGRIGANGSRWFGRTITWANQTQLGWRLGMEARPPDN
jgi:Glyoxalase-like domain